MARPVWWLWRSTGWSTAAEADTKPSTAVVKDCEKHEAALRLGWRVYRVPGPWIQDSDPADLAA